jgi:phosphatidate cytidylyltransferase
LARCNRLPVRRCVLRTRLLTAAVVLPPLIALIIFAPAWSISLVAGLCAAWGLYEMAAMAPTGAPVAIPILLIAGVLPAGVALGQVAPLPSAALAAAAVVIMCGLIVWVDRRGRQTAAAHPLLLAIGALYVGALFPYFALLRNRVLGTKLLLLMLSAVVAGDSGAYFVGRAVGRVKLIPAVSPGKTVEGALAYVACGIAAVCALTRPLGVSWNAETAVGFGILVSIVAQLGDLAESAFKRLAGVKDSGWLFPGHGGLLDRTDSLVFAAFFAYYYSCWLGVGST